MNKPANKTLRSMSVARSKYVRAIENQARLNAFGALNSSEFSSRRMNARQRRRFRHWDHVADRMADRMIEKLAR